MNPVVRTVKFAAIIIAVLWCSTRVAVITIYGADGVIAVFMANVMTPTIVYSAIRAPR